jgi:hypothetical protein
MVDVPVLDPAYSDVTVVNSPVTGVDCAGKDMFCAGTRTIRIPISPGKDGVAIVTVVATGPAYGEEIVVNSDGT